MKMMMIVAVAVLALTATAQAAGQSRHIIGYTSSAWGKTVYSP
ncbi:hypothetical protein [Devosia yakushimensis]|nr:hypothetical protein [Devosia yakushimensis]